MLIEIPKGSRVEFSNVPGKPIADLSDPTMKGVLVTGCCFYQDPDSGTLVITPATRVDTDHTLKPYIQKTVTLEAWNPLFLPGAICSCGHKYVRHFDSYDDMANIGCKYCPCMTWRPPNG